MLEQNYSWREKQQFRDIARRYKELPNCAQYGAVYAKRRTNNDDASWQRAESHAYSTVPNSLTTARMRMTTCDIARMMICVVTVDGTPDSYGLFIANDLIWPQLDW